MKNQQYSVTCLAIILVFQNVKPCVSYGVFKIFCSKVDSSLCFMDWMVDIAFFSQRWQLKENYTILYQPHHHPTIYDECQAQ